MENVGIDIVEIARVKKAIQNERFVKKVLSEDEIEKYNSFSANRQVEFIAGRFAAKEAIIKCLSDHEIPSMSILNIVNSETGKPMIKYKDYRILLSISHEKEYAVAIAMLEENK